jgi:hypothetical protein
MVQTAPSPTSILTREEYIVTRRESLITAEPFGSRSGAPQSNNEPIKNTTTPKDVETNPANSPSSEVRSFLLVDDNPINLKVGVLFYC